MSQPSHPPQPSRRLPPPEPPQPGAPSTPNSPTALPAPPPFERITLLTARAQRGDAAALNELCQAMRAGPWLARQLSDFAHLTRQNMARLALGEKNLLVHDVLARHLAAVQTRARVSRVLAPAIAQVNLAAPGAQQLNLAAPPA